VTNEPRRAWRTDAEWNRLRERIDGAPLVRPPKRFGPTPWLAAAATIVVVAFLGWRMTRPKPEQRTVTTAAGERIEIKLADGTVITLGPASTLRYSSDKERSVSLDGLANFDVVHDASRPFVVRAGNAVATDLGTEFVVRAYRTDSIVDVAVKSGRVALSGTSRVDLEPGALGRVHADGSTTRGDSTAAASHLAWVNGRLAFDAEPLAGVATELSRWFNVDVRIDEALASQRVTAVYNTPTLDGVLEALTASLDVRVERAGRIITIAPRTK
jgi:transmembrane sensor